MNLKKFISDNIVDLGDQEEATTTKVAPNTPPVQQSPRGPQTTQPSAWIDTGSPSPSAPQYQDASPVAPSVLEGARKHFKDTLKAYHDNTKANDYYTLITAKKAMDSVIPVESQRYLIAFTTLQAAGLTKDAVLQTGQQYMDAVDQELNNFNSSFEPSYKAQVADKKTLIEQKQAQMMELSKQIQAINDEIKQMNDDVIASEGTLLGAKSAFERAGKEAKDEITTELGKINQYIQQ